MCLVKRSEIGRRVVQRCVLMSCLFLSLEPAVCAVGLQGRYIGVAEEV